MNYTSDKYQNRKLHGFTLIELLIVIMIIGLLVGLLMPALASARNQAKKIKAQASIQALAMGLKGYYNEYGNWPPLRGNAIPDSPLTADEMNQLYLVMIGDDSMATINPKKIAFIDFRKRDVKNIGGDFRLLTAGKTAFVDPWDNGYRVALDHDGDNNVAPYGGSKMVGGGIAVWSTGPDRNQVDNDDPLNPTDTNKDNITSWR